MTPLTQPEVTQLREQYPELMPDYLEHMALIGWGAQPNGRMLYSGPVHPADVYGDAFSDSALLLLGDDGCGYCFGFDPGKSIYGELTDCGEWIPCTDHSLASYVS